MLTISREHAIDIFDGKVPGLYRLDLLGCYGYYLKYRVTYADLCSLWSYELFINESIQNDIKFSLDSEGRINVNRVEMNVNHNIEYKAVS